MKILSQKSYRIFNKLVEQAEQNNGYIKIDNTNQTFMPVSVEIIRENEKLRIVSIAHYYEQNGDLMVDPEMLFIENKINKVVYPCYYRLDGLGIEQTSCDMNMDLEISNVNIILQQEHTIFANIWFNNIKNQQNL